jgi:hypothetical protein
MTPGFTGRSGGVNFLRKDSLEHVIVSFRGQDPIGMVTNDLFCDLFV